MRGPFKNPSPSNTNGGPQTPTANNMMLAQKPPRRNDLPRGLVITTAILVILCLAVGIAFAAFFSQYSDYKNNGQQKVNDAVSAARDEQQKADTAKYAQEAKSPTLQYKTSPDFGRVTFSYPKTWSSYNVTDGTSATSQNDFSTYFSPKNVPPVNGSINKVFALELHITSSSYNDAIKKYDGKVKKGDIKASPLTLGATADFSGYQGMRFDGKLDQGIDGSVVLFKVRDKTVLLQTDAQEFIADFDKFILPTLKYEQ